MRLIKSIWIILLPLMMVAGAASASTEQWLFTVRLDDKTIGQHSFVRTGTRDAYRMDIRADFKATLFLVVPFRYEHRNLETWKEGCLQAIESNTNDNGDRFDVKGSVKDSAFDIVANGKNRSLTGCVSTFAYWDPGFLKQASLLNSQDGQYTAVKVRMLGEDTIRALGKDMKATRYKLKAGELTINLWYTAEGEWLRLESPVKGGMTLIYERIEP